MALSETIYRLRTERGLSQGDLAAKLDVSRQSISKWETAKGYPDITLIEPLAQALDISVMELLSGDCVTNANRAGNLLRAKWYVCPICGNVIHTLGDTVISCCGVSLPALEAEAPDEHHEIQIEPVEDEHFITVHHPMTKSHYISFLAYVTSEKFQMIKLYPEGNAECRFRLRGRGYLYCYCNRHGLMMKQIR